VSVSDICCIVWSTPAYVTCHSYNNL